MEFYEFDDFIQNPDLVNNKTACDSLLSQLLVSTTTITGDVRDKSRILYQILFVANKFSQENDMDAPAAVNITDKGMNLFVNFNYIQKGFGREEYLTVLLLIFIMYDTLTNVSNPIYKNADKMKSLLINFEFTGIIVSVVLIVLMSYTSIILPISIVIWALTVLFNPLLWPDSKEQDENK